MLRRRRLDPIRVRSRAGCDTFPSGGHCGRPPSNLLHCGVLEGSVRDVRVEEIPLSQFSSPAPFWSTVRGRWLSIALLLFAGGAVGMGMVYALAFKS